MRRGTYNLKFGTNTAKIVALAIGDVDGMVCAFRAKAETAARELATAQPESEPGSGLRPPCCV